MTTRDQARPLHPRHGIHHPSTGTPGRTPGSMRRTSTIDMLRPQGLHGPLVLAARGRDLFTRESTGVRASCTTGPDRPPTADIVAMASARVVIDFPGDRTVRELTTDPCRSALAALAGQRAGAGFRGLLDAADPRLHAEHDLLYHLLDEIPATALVSGHAVAAAAASPGDRDLATMRPPRSDGLCAGFADGGTIMSEIERSGRPPLAIGPAAPPLALATDPLAWHHVGPLPAQGMRRSRRIDVRPLRTGGMATVDAFFRDSYVLPDGLETVVHEYSLTAEVDTVDSTLTACRAWPRVLPWLECPAAAVSARRLAGVPLEGLRRHVGVEFTGALTCTHLNDLLRSLEDVAVLLRLAAAHRR